jgi:hypothetical protein
VPPWKLKAAVQGVLSLLPEPQRWNRLFQTYVTGSLDLGDEYFLEKWRQTVRHIEHAERRGGIARARVMELGTGWFPVAPVGMALAGAASVVSVDLNDLLAHDNLVATLVQYDRMIARGLVALPLSAHKRVKELLKRAPRQPAREILGELGITSLVSDARTINRATGTIDLFTSNNVFEHIPCKILLDILREYRRLASPAALMSHYIDMADHYAGFDKSISVYNFLRYSERQWRLFNNQLHYQNRLRASDFRTIHREAGWDVVSEESRREEPEILRKLSLATEFRRYDEDDLLIYKCWMISQPAA